MEVFIPLLTWSLAVTDTFAYAFYGQNVPLIAEFAVSDMHSAFIFILVGKLWWAYLDDNNFLMEVMIINCQWRSHVGLHGVAREFNAWIVLIFAIYGTKDIIKYIAETWKYYLVNQLLRSKIIIVVFQLTFLSRCRPRVYIHALFACSYVLKTVDELIFVIS